MQATLNRTTQTGSSLLLQKGTPLDIVTDFETIQVMKDMELLIIRGNPCF